MKIVVIGGTGLIDSKTAILRQGGREVVASPQSGINTITGEGLKEAVAGAQVVIDRANSPSSKTRRCWNSSRPPAASASTTGSVAHSQKLDRRCARKLTRWHELISRDERRRRL